jgi:hypothetical protein
MGVGSSSPKQAYLCEGGSKFDEENGQQQAGGFRIRTPAEQEKNVERKQH